MEDLQILIVEDEVLIAEDLKDLLQSFGVTKVNMVHSLEQALEALKNSLPDVALLDIRMEGEMDGLKIAESINENSRIPFVFITSHSDLETIKRIVKEKPAAYLSKPFKKSDLFAVLNMVNEKKNSEGKKVMIKDGNKTIVLEPNEIVYIEGEGNYINIFTAGKKIVARQSLESVYGLLEQDLYFRIHRSFIVNLDQIDSYTRKEIKIGGTIIPLSRSTQTLFDEVMFKRRKK